MAMHSCRAMADSVLTIRALCESHLLALISTYICHTDLAYGYRVVETDSAENLKLNGQLLYAPGKFSGSVLTSPLWSFVA